jgi:predicted permease
VKEFLLRLHYLLHRGRFDRELSEEMEAHREMAGREGNQNFGDPLRLREESREAWGWTWIDRLLQDLRFAARLLARSPGFTLVSVLILAIGIGINVAAFGFFNLLVFKPLPVREPETLLRFHRLAPQNYSSDVAYPAMAFYRENAKTLSAVLALDEGRLMMDGGETPLRAFYVTANFFQELGAGAKYGRLFEPSLDDARGAAPVVVLGHDFWKRNFGGDPSVVGRTIRLGGKPVVVAGVVSGDFSGLTYNAPDVWLPITQQPHFVEGSQLLTSYSPETDGVDMWGRLGPGSNAKAAEEEMKSLTAELRRQHPNDVWENEGLMSEPGGFAQNAGGRSRGNAPSPNLQAKLKPILALIGALALLILAVACGNLGSLLLARGVARQREIMIRTALGAGSGRLVRQLLTESLLLALLGSAAGLLLGVAVLEGMMTWSAAPAWLSLKPDWRVIAFTAAVGLAAALLFGLTPAFQVARQRRNAHSTRKFLISVQVAASCVLLIVAGLLVRALNHAMSGDPGFEYKQVVLIDPPLSFHGYSPAAARAYLDTLQNRLRSVPGVAAVSLAATPPLGNRSSTAKGDKDGRSFDIYLNRVDAEFLRTMKIPLLLGRNLRTGEKDVVVVSDSLACRMWPGEDPLGKQFELDDRKYPVVGVSGSARALALADPDAVEVYQPIEEGNLPSMAVLVRTSGPVEGLARTLATIARTNDPKVAPAVQTLKSAFARKLEGPEKSALAVTVLGIVALLLACLGITGVVAYEVSQRTKEIGIRMALGAKASHVLTAILRQFSKPVIAGLALGVGCAAALSQILRQQLFGISNLDPVAYLAAVTVFAITAVGAALLPARRALRADPMRSLRQD